MSSIRELFEAFLYLRRQQGWREAFGQAWQFLRTPFFESHRGFVLRKSLREPLEIPPPDIPVEIRQAMPDDRVLLETIVPPLRVKRFAGKMTAGEICFIAIQDQKVVAYVFAALADTPSTRDARLKLGPREAYLWAGYALPEYRRQGVVRAVNLSLCRLLQERGYEGVVLQVDGDNEASLGHCYKMGYRLTERVRFLKILGWRMRRDVPVAEPARDRAPGGE